MKPQLRAYILVVGRDKDDAPVRKLAKYTGRPLAGLMDNYEGMNAAELRSCEAHLDNERSLIEDALSDIQAEKFDRLSRQFPSRSHDQLIQELMNND